MNNSEKERQFDLFETPGCLLDTNIFYSSANGKFAIDTLRKKYGPIFLSPVSIFEMLASVNEDNFLEMKKVAKEMLLADLILPDPNEYLIAAWGLIDRPIGTAENYRQELHKFLKCDSFLNFETEARKYNQLRNKSEQGFLEITEEGKETIIPDYTKIRSKGKMAQLTKSQNSQYSQRLFHPSSIIKVLLETHKKASSQLNLLKPDSANPIITKQQLELASERIEFYILMAIVYMAYILDHAPKHNDLADRELLVYLNNKRRFLTGDGKWLDIAKAIGLELLILDPSI